MKQRHLMYPQLLSRMVEMMQLNKSINITNLNDEIPEFTSSDTFSVDENQIAIGTVTASDRDGDDLTFSASNTDIQITSNGILTFKSAPDYETQSQYSVSVVVSDGENTNTQNITVNIVNINEFPPEFGATEFSILEQETAIGTIEVTDGDNDQITLSISGNDAAFINLNSGFRTLSFKNPPNFDDKSQYQVLITANDGKYNVSENFTINITELPALPNHPQAIVGTDDSDTLVGTDRQYDILIGGQGDDTLTGGNPKSALGGYIINIFQFTDNSGNDIITDFFIQEVYERNSSLGYGPVDGRYRSDIIEITSNINGTNISTANEIIQNSSNNSNNYAVINLGQGNTVTLEGVNLSDVKPEHFHIIPSKAEVIQGTNGNDFLSATQFNSRVEGSDDPMDRFEDGYDVIESGIGDDILLGGTNDSATGGYILDLYKFQKIMVMI